MYRLLAAAVVASVTIAPTGKDTSVMNNFFSRLAFGKNKVLGGWQLKFDTYAFAAPPAAAGRFGNAGHGENPGQRAQDIGFLQPRDQRFLDRRRTALPIRGTNFI